MWAFLVLWLGNAAWAQAGSTIVINEIFYDAEGSDTDKEWVELKNNSSQSIDLTNWKIQSAGVGFSGGVAIPAGTILAPGAYLVIDDAHLPSLQNGGEATDGVRLLDATGQVIDVVLYDEPNTNNLPDETGAAGTLPASAAPAGASLARLPDGADSNVSAIDFAPTGQPTPGSANVAAALPSPTPTPLPTPSSSPITSPSPSPSSSPKSSPSATPAGPYATTIVINEFLPNSAGSDITDEFIELKNNGLQAVDLTAWQLDDSEGGSSPYRIPASLTLASGTVRSFFAAETKLALNNTSDAVRLLSPDGKVQHQFSYAKTIKGKSYNRLDNGSFVVSSLPTPGQINAVVAAVTTTTAPTTALAQATPTPRPSSSPTSGAVAGTTIRSTPLAVLNVAPPAKQSFIQQPESTLPLVKAMSPSPATPTSPTPVTSPTPPNLSLDRSGLFKVGGLLLAALAVFGLTSYKSWLPFI